MAARILGDGEPLPACLAVPPPATVAERLAVYANGYPARVHDALLDTYEALARIVGAEAFAALAERYAETVPLTSYNLNDAGAGFAAFVAGDRLGRERPFLSDLAALEWAVAQAFHAAERPPLDPGSLSWTLDDWDRAVLEFQPSLALLTSSWPLLAMWKDDGAPEDGGRVGDDGEHILVRRAGLMVRCESISAGEAAALRLLCEGSALGACMQSLDAGGHDPAVVSEWFARWMQSGMIAGAQLAA